MKRLLIIHCLFAAFTIQISAKVYTIADSIDNSPIVGVTFIGKSGVIAGLTDNNGSIDLNLSEFPASIKCIGYEDKTINGICDTIWMQPLSYELKEIIVTNKERPVIRVLSYVREYSSGISGKDTLQLYCEYMAESFLAYEKTKGYKSCDAKLTAKGVKRYARISKDGIDSIFCPSYKDDITDLSWFDFIAFIPTDKDTNIPEKIIRGAETDTIHGKYGPKFMFKKKNGLFTKTADVLSDKKDRKWSPWIFKLLGMTVDIESGTWTLSFNDNGTDKLSIYDFNRGCYNIHLTGRGKWLKKAFGTKEPIEMNTYIELYPVEITHCSIAEYKEAKDDFTAIPFIYPDKIQPLSPAIQNLKEILTRKQ